MPDIKFYCPLCGSKLGVDESAAGYFVPCPDCGGNIRIPSETQETTPASAGTTQRIPPVEEADPGAADRIRQLEHELERERGRVKEAGGLESRVTELQRQLEVAREQADTARKASAEALAQSEASARLVADLERKRAEQDAAAEERAQQAKALEAEKSQLVKKAETARTASATRIDELTRQVHGLEQQLETQARAAEERNTREAALQAEVTQLSEALKESETARREAAERSVQQSSRASEEQSERIQELVDTVDDARHEAASLAEKLAAAEANVRQLLEEKEGLAERLLAFSESAAREKKALEETVTGLRSELAGMRVRADEARATANRVEGLQSRVKAVEEEKARLHAALGELEREKASLQERIVAADEQVARLSSGIKEPDRVLTEDRKTHVRAAESGPSSEASRLREEAEKLRLETLALQERRTSAEARASVLQEDNARLRQRVEQLTTEKQARAEGTPAMQREPGPAGKQPEPPPKVDVWPSPTGKTNVKEREEAAETGGAGATNERARSRVNERGVPPALATADALPHPAMPVKPDNTAARPVGGDTLYQKRPRSARRGAGYRWTVALVTLCILVSAAGVALKLVRPEILEPYLARLSSVFSAGTGSSGVAPTATSGLHPKEGRETSLTLGASVMVNNVEFCVQRVAIEPVERTVAPGKTVVTEQPYLVLDIEVRNTSTDQTLYLASTWDQSVLRDDLGHSTQPAFPDPARADAMIGATGMARLAPGQTLKKQLVFASPGEDSSSFTLNTRPGFWYQSPEGQYLPTPRSAITVRFKREDLSGPEEKKGEAAMRDVRPRPALPGPSGPDARA